MRWFLPILATAATACSQHVFEARFASDAVRLATSRVDVFAFGPGGGVDCSTFDPRGRGAGDAEVRTGVRAAAKATSELEDEIARLEVPEAGVYALVIEAWGPGCAELTSGTSPGCLRFAADGPDILRGHYCNTLELSNERVFDITADLESFTKIGAQIEIPGEAERFGPDDPLDVASGELAREPFVVRLIDVDAAQVPNYPVHFSVVSGRASVVEAQPLRTSDDQDLRGEGIAAATLRIGADAHTIDDGRIVVEAYAAGFDGAPLTFEARAVPSVDVRTEVVPIPDSIVNVAASEPISQRLIAADLDGDGDLDYATYAGWRVHRLVVVWHEADGYRVELGPEVDGEPRALATANLFDGGPSIILASARYDPGDQEATPAGTTYVIKEPKLSIYDPSNLAMPRTVDRIGGVPMTKVPIWIEAEDLDGDGYDDLAMSQCSYVFRIDSEQTAFIPCFSQFNDDTDSEIGIWVRDDPGSLTFEQAATIASLGNEGGFRELVFADINSDGSPDVVAATNSNVIGVCGQRNQPGSGFGFPSNPRMSANISFGRGYSVAVGRLDDDGTLDAIVTGGIRAGGPNAGIKVVPGAGCEAFGDGPNSIVTGRRSFSHLMSVRAAHLNDDEWSDVIVRHGNEQRLSIFLGGGELGLAGGPVVELPAGATTALAVGEETIEGERAVVAATLSADDGVLVLARIRPR